MTKKSKPITLSESKDPTKPRQPTTSKSVRVEPSRDTGQPSANLPSLDGTRDERGGDNLPEELAFTPVPRQVQAGRNTITADRQRAFILALAQTGSVTIASRVIGNAPASLYTLKLVPGAESFAAAWDAAVQLGARQILDILVDHAINGTPEYIDKDGEIVAERRIFNHRMMMWIVTHAMPEYFGASTGLVPHGATSSGMKKLKAKWEKEWREEYERAADLSAGARRAQEEREREEQRRELLPAVLVRIYQNKVREERSYRLQGKTPSADMTLRQLTHIELYMEFAGMVEPEIVRFFDSAQSDPHPWETEAGRAIVAHREAAWAMDGHVESAHPELVEGPKSNESVRPEPVEPEAQPETTGGQLRPQILQYGPKGPPHSALHCGPTTSERTRARQQAEAQMAEAQKLWEACATEESWASFTET